MLPKSYFSKYFLFFNRFVSSTLKTLQNVKALDIVEPDQKNVPSFFTKEIHLQNFKSFNDHEENLKHAAQQIHDAVNSKKLVPDQINLDQIQTYLKRESRSQKLKYLAFLFKKEKMKASYIVKKEKKRIERDNAKLTVLNEITKDSHYGLGKNSLLINVRKKSINKFYCNRMAHAVLFGPDIVIDLDYDQHMWDKERRDCVSQLRYLYHVNRTTCYPYNIHFCNAKSSSYCVKYLYEEMPNVDSSFISLTEKNYLDIFPKDKLVYLSPHAETSLETYDHSAVYIIGGFVDTIKREHLSLHKAEAEGIKCYSLPIDEYVSWGCGSRSLSINQVFQIMLEMKTSGDWMKAFSHIPSRKVQKLSTAEKSELVLQ